MKIVSSCVNWMRFERTVKMAESRYRVVTGDWLVPRSNAKSQTERIENQSESDLELVLPVSDLKLAMFYGTSKFLFLRINF